jgi:hypothetical protein
MTKFTIHVKKQDNSAKLFELSTDTNVLDNLPDGTPLTIVAKETGYKEQYVGPMKVRSTVKEGSTPPAPNPDPNPNPEPNPQPGTLIYDSDVDIDWAKWDGKVIDTEHPYGDTNKPNSKYIRMNASGDPKIKFLSATKELELSHGGKYGRAYFGVCNYGCRIEVEIKQVACDQKPSIKSRNRHQYRQYLREAKGYTEEQANAVPDEQVQGGQGLGIDCGSVDNDLEVKHGSEVSGPSKSFSPQQPMNQYYKVEFSQFDKNGKIHVQDKINGNVVCEGDVSAPSQFFNKAQFMEWSEIWFRLNTGDSGGKIYFKNIKVYAL